MGVLPRHRRGEAQERAGLGELGFSRDSDGLEASAFSRGAAPFHAAPYRYTGILARTLRYSQAGWVADGKAIALQDRRRYSDGWLHIDAGLARLGGTSVSAAVSRGWFDESGRSVELMLERNLVDSREGIEKNLTATLVGVGGDLPLTTATMLTGTAAVQYVEDNNWRTHLRLRLSHEIVAAPAAVQLQARYRGIRADNPHTGNYFNPRSFDEVLFGAFWRVDRSDWRGILWAGAGTQRVDGNTQDAYAVEASLVSPRLAELPAYLTLSFGVKHDGARAGGYTYRYVSASFAARF